MVTLLLDAGAAVDARADGGRTPLFTSVNRIDLATTRLLLERGASVDVIDEGGDALGDGLD